MLAWKAGIGRERKLCDGTVAGLVRAYQVDRASPYHELKWNTRRTYDELLDKVVKAIGGRVLAAIGMSDLRRWYDAAKRPKVEAGAERVDRAHKFIEHLARNPGLQAGEVSESARRALLFGI